MRVDALPGRSIPGALVSRDRITGPLWCLDGTFSDAFSSITAYPLRPNQNTLGTYQLNFAVCRRYTTRQEGCPPDCSDLECRRQDWRWPSQEADWREAAQLGETLESKVRDAQCRRKRWLTWPPSDAVGDLRARHRKLRRHY